MPASCLNCGNPPIKFGTTTASYPNRDTAKAAGAESWLRIVTAKPRR